MYFCFVIHFLFASTNTAHVVEKTHYLSVITLILKHCFRVFSLFVTTPIQKYKNATFIN